MGYRMDVAYELMGVWGRPTSCMKVRVSGRVAVSHNEPARFPTTKQPVMWSRVRVKVRVSGLL